MSEIVPINKPAPQPDIADAQRWLAQVLSNFAKAEQAIGELCLALDLPIKNGALTSIAELRKRLSHSENRRCKSLDRRIARWKSLRPIRHMLAHATLRVLFDEDQSPVCVTRHLPLDKNDVSPDRVWSDQERFEVLKAVSNDGRSIS